MPYLFYSLHWCTVTARKSQRKWKCIKPTLLDILLSILQHFIRLKRGHGSWAWEINLTSFWLPFNLTSALTSSSLKMAHHARLLIHEMTNASIDQRHQDLPSPSNFPIKRPSPPCLLRLKTILACRSFRCFQDCKIYPSFCIRSYNCFRAKHLV